MQRRIIALSGVAAGLVLLVPLLACGGAATQSEPSSSTLPEGYEVLHALSAGGVVACGESLSDCGALDEGGTWRKGPGCRGRMSGNPPRIICDGATFYVLPDGSAKPLPDHYLPPKYSPGETNRLIVQDKSIAEMDDHAEYEYGYVLLNERLEVVAEYGRKVRRIFSFKDGRAEVVLPDGKTRGHITLDGELVVEGE